MADPAPGIVSGATQDVSNALNAVPGTLESGANSLAGMPQDIANLPFISQMLQVMPAADMAFGGAMLVFIVLFHGAAIRALTSHLVRRSQFILANRPVRGLDVGAIAYVHGRLIAARDAGAAVLLISEDLDEVQSLSDVIHVISEGRLSPGFERGSMTPAALGLWMAGQGFEHAA